MFLLPNGKYANANEVGNYHIGFVFGYAGTSSPCILGDLYSRLKTGKADNPNEIKIVDYANQLGYRLRNYKK